MGAKTATYVCDVEENRNGGSALPTFCFPELLEE
jgi:hypothetical protein